MSWTAHCGYAAKEADSNAGYEVQSKTPCVPIPLNVKWSNPLQMTLVNPESQLDVDMSAAVAYLNRLYIRFERRAI